MSTQSFADRRSLEGVKPGVVVVGGLLALMWVLEIIDSASFHSLDQLGIIARNLGSLPHILTAPWLHFGFPHLISNSVPFLILGLLTWLAGPGRWLAQLLGDRAVGGRVLLLRLDPAGRAARRVGGLMARTPRWRHRWFHRSEVPPRQRPRHPAGLTPAPLARFAGLTVNLLAVVMFAGLTAQANVNKPSKPTRRPANPESGGPTG